MRKWLLWIGGFLLVLVAGLGIAAWWLSGRIEPYLREQTIAYLSKRFASEVALAALEVSMPIDSPLDIALRGGRGAVVKVTARGIELRHLGRRDFPPLFRMRTLSFRVDLYTVWNPPAVVQEVRVDGLELHIPPKGQRPAWQAPQGKKNDQPPPRIEKVIADGARLSILPKDPAKLPLEFAIFKLTLTGAGPGAAMNYDAGLTNAKPPGVIQAKGTFGPWQADEPSDTHLTGDYRLEKADLGVFSGIAGTLESTGRFQGPLASIVVDGETRTPDFRLRTGGAAVPLTTRFHAIVNGTNGDTRLEPVIATLGRSRFEVRGAVARDRNETRKTVTLDAKFLNGFIEDALRLAMKGEPILRGPLTLNVKIEVPPGKGPIAERLRLDGEFFLKDAHFTTATVQEQIDSLSRRGQGRPRDAAVAEVPADLEGAFVMGDGRIDFSRLRFIVPGAAVDLTGGYGFRSEELDFHGTLKLDAKVSQTMSGWKRWVLKPADPFFAKQGAGTLLKIQVVGSRAQPKFGLDKKSGAK